MDAWFAETGHRGAIAEINVPAMSLIHGLVGGSAIRRSVQLGHYFGYSALLLGFLLRAMDARPGLVTIDVDPAATDFTGRWVRRAGLQDHVHVQLGDSADPACAGRALELLGGASELVLVDSSHAYRHTLAELDLWSPLLAPDALVLLHDVSEFAASFDPDGEGGVRRALREWLPGHPEMTGMLLNGGVRAGADANLLAYKDGAGLGILQRMG